jgi:hypothetical protein
MIRPHKGPLRAIVSSSIVGILLLGAQMLFGPQAGAVGWCRKTDCAQGPMEPTQNQNPGNNAGRNDNTKAPPDCGAMRNEMGQLCQKYQSSSTEDRIGIRGQINNLQHQWSGSSCGTEPGLGCGPDGSGPVQPSGKPAGSTTGSSTSGDSGSGDSGTGSGTTASGTTPSGTSASSGQNAPSGTNGVILIDSGKTAAPAHSPPVNHGFVAIPVNVLHH